MREREQARRDERSKERKEARLAREEFMVCGPPWCNVYTVPVVARTITSDIFQFVVSLAYMLFSVHTHDLAIDRHCWRSCVGSRPCTL